MSQMDLEKDVPSEISVDEMHAEMVSRLIKNPATILESLTQEDAHLIHMGMGIATEACELLDAIKAKVIYRKKLDMDNIVEELGDLEFFLEGLRDCLGIARPEVLSKNIVKLNTRYGEKYSDQAGIERKDKQQ